MNKLNRKSLNQFDKKRFNKEAKRRFKKEFKKKVSVTEINEIVKNWLHWGLIAEVLKGGEHKIDKNSSIEVIGTPIMSDERMLNNLMNGRVLTRTGKFKKADNIASTRKDFKYKIVYKNSLAKDKNIMFQACPKFAKQVHERLINTNTYFKTEQCQ